jgi:Fic family protein
VKRGRRELLPERRDKFEVRLNREAGLTVEECAKLAGISRATCLRYLAELREVLGPEKLPNGRRARSYLRRLEIPRQ